MTREEMIDFCEMKAQLEPENENIFNHIAKILEQETVSRETYESEYLARKQAELELWEIQQNTSKDCVNRANLLEEFEDRFFELQKAHRKDAQLGVNWCINTLKEMPPVTPTCKKGKWIRKPVRNDKGGCVGAEMICTCCGKDNECDKNLNYCPNCGIEMEMEE